MELHRHHKPAVIGVDIGGTKIAAGIVTATGAALHLLSAPTPSTEGALAILAKVAELAKKLCEVANHEGFDIGGIGIGAGGQIDVVTGQVLYATDVIPGWKGAEIVKSLETKLCLPVKADNDVNVLALAEHRFGAARPYRDVLFVAVGTGVGGALILNNQLRHGASYSAGEIAHLLVEYQGGRLCKCGQFGHLEAYTAGPAIALQYSQAVGLALPCNLPWVARQVQQGDLLAITAIKEGARILGKALAGVLALLDLQALVIGGGVTQLGAVWWNPLVDELRSNSLPGVAQIPIHLAELGQSAAIIGAGMLIK